MKKIKIGRMTNLKTILISTYALNLFDLVVTMVLFAIFGSEIELNPLAIILYNYGLIYPAKIIGIGAALCLMYFSIIKVPRLEWTKWIVFDAYAMLAVYHIWGCGALINAAKIS